MDERQQVNVEDYFLKIVFPSVELGAALLEDEGNFIDHSKSSALIIKEHELQTANKLMEGTAVDPPRVRVI